jgi:O-antigen/teichoic acid export membrane protein
LTEPSLIEHEGARRLALRIARGVGWIFVGRMGSRGVTLVVNVAATKLLVPAGVGTLLLANSLVLIGATVARWGMEFAAVRLLARSTASGEWFRARATVQRTLAGTLIGAGIAGGILLAGGWRWLSLHGFHSDRMASLQTSIALLLFLTALQQTVSNWFRGLQRMRVVAIFDEFMVNVLWCISLLALWVGHRTPSVNALVWLRVGALGLVLASMLVLFRRPYGRLAGEGGSRPTLRELLGLGSTGVVITTVLLVVGTTSDMAILGLYRPQSDVGAYGIAASLSALVAAPFLASTVVFGPVLASVKTARDRTTLERPLQAIVAAVSVPAIVVAVVFAAAGASILSFAFGSSYARAGHLLAVLSLAQAVFVMTGPCNLALGMMDRLRVSFVLAVASAAASVGADFFAAPRWGGIGVAVATSSALAVSNVVTAVVAKRLTGVSTYARFSRADVKAAIRTIHEVMRRRPVPEQAPLGSK